MPLEATIDRDDRVYAGVDKAFRFTIYEDATKTACVDVSTFALSWKLAVRPGVSAAVTKTLGSGITITGAFNVSPALNTQRVVVTVLDTDTEALAAGTWWHELYRTNDGFEDVLAGGSFYLHKRIHTS